MNPSENQPHASLELLEAERQRFAHSLQTSIIAQLNLVLAQANAYEQTMSANPQAHLVASVLSSLLRQLLQQARDLEENLQPSVLQSLGLESALELFANQQLRSTGLVIRLRLQRLRKRLDTELELNLYRLAQHVAEEIFRHCRASQLTIVLQTQKTVIEYHMVYSGETLDADFLARLHTQAQMSGLEMSLEHTQNEHHLLFWLPLMPDIEFTERELEVLGLLSHGLSNAQLAERLVVSLRTVKFHLDNIYSKIGVKSRTEAVVFAYRYRLVKPEPLDRA